MMPSGVPLQQCRPGRSTLSSASPNRSSNGSFAGRVAGRLLRAVGLDEMITHSLQEYESLALSLAQNPRQLASVKDKLARNRNAFPLFDAERFTRHMEQAFVKMWERYQSGEMPASSGQRAPIQIR